MKTISPFFSVGENLLDICNKCWPIHCAIDDIRRGHAIEPQGGDERQRLPVTVWHARDKPLAARAAAVVTNHFRRDRGLVNEHQARRPKRRLLGFQRGAGSRNIRTILLGGVQTFFERDLLTIVEAPDRARSNLELLRAAEPQADVIERQVRLRSDKIEQPLLMLVAGSETDPVRPSPVVPVAASRPPPKPRCDRESRNQICEESPFEWPVSGKFDFHRSSAYDSKSTAWDFFTDDSSKSDRATHASDAAAI